MAFLLFAVALRIPLQAQETSFDKNKIQDFFQHQEFEDAIIYLNPFLATDSSNTVVLGYLGFAHSMNSNEKLARKYYRQLYEYDTTNLAAIQFLAYSSNREDGGASLSMSRKLILLQPGKSSHFRRLADILSAQQEKDSAFYYYSQAYRMSPGDYRNAAGLAGFFLESKQYPQADSILSIGLQQDSMNGTLLKLGVRSAHGQQDYARVTLLGERLMQLEDISVTILSYVALAHYSLKNYQDCIRVCDYMMNHEVEVEAFYYYAGKAYAKLGNFDKSNELLEICIASSISKNIDLYYTAIANNHEAQSKFRKAINFYDTAYYLTKDPLAYYNMGRVYESNINDPRQAQKYYTRFVSNADPASPELKEAYHYAKERLDKYKQAGNK
jgi:tetratricopeptide (TPR) repeat protein